MEPYRVVVMEDDEDILEILSLYIQNEGYDLQSASTIAEAEVLIDTFHPDLLIFDVNLPDGNGFELAKKIRTKTDAILIFLTVNESLDHKLEGFDVGADDYVTKPFIPKELIARMNAHMKRRHSFASDQILTFDELTIHMDEKQVYKRGDLIPLFTKEKQLLFYLVENRNQVLTFEQIIDHIWGIDGIVDLKTLSVHISTLRRKIEDNPKKPRWIMTMRGFGYKFQV